MHSDHLNSGIVYTNQYCIGCNKCISSCNAVGANVVVKDPLSDEFTVMVDPTRCILCGECIHSCTHGARTYRDDTEALFAALEQGEQISVLVSPTLLANYESQYHNILGYLRAKGVNHIYSTGYGGDLMVWVCMSMIREFGLSGVISQCCPVIVNYLEKYKPELLPYLLPIQSPAMCTAIYVSDYLNITDNLAYISPCIASLQEIRDVNTYGKVTYNITVERLMQRLQTVDLSTYYAEDELSYGLGALIPMSGGLSDNVERYIGFDEVLIQTEGPTNIFPYFDHYAKVVCEESRLPFLVDALCCTSGCNFGTGISGGAEVRNEMTFSAHRIRENAYSTGVASNARTREEREEMLNKRFANVELSSFVRQFDLMHRVAAYKISNQEIEQIFQSMHKTTLPQQYTDCGACGYHTCREMAIAIGSGLNQKENCITYAKECVRMETEKINNLLAEISSMNEELRKSSQLKSNFLANMSHEIRTPMNAIIGMAEMALRGLMPAEERGYIQQIKSSGRSLLAIINDILDFSKIESGKLEINEAEYCIMSVINDTNSICITRVGEKDITLIVDVDPNLPALLYGDDVRIKQVLVNLINNAIKFTNNGSVEISVQQTPLDDEHIWLEVAVHDTGIGIRPDDLEKLFHSFEQVDSKRNRNVEGTGLGLAISRQLVALMDGTVDVQSVYGEGSTFSFRVPQRVVNSAPCVALSEDEPLITASLIQNPFVREGFCRAACCFPSIQNTECADFDTIMAAVDAGARYVFINFPCFTPAMDDYFQAHSEVQAALIVNPSCDDVTTAAHMRHIHQPLFCLNIASFLNAEIAQTYGHDLEAKGFRFEAPDAHILIVDDNAINLTVAKGLLSPLCMAITVASSAQEAITALEGGERYDLIFMDHMMPDIDGVEATHMIRAMDGAYFKAVPIIALSANAVNNARELFLSEGMNDFVAKPIDMADISAKLKRWLPQEKIRDITKPPETQSPAEVPAPLEIEGLDVTAALALSGSLDLYRTILCDYYKVIEKKADLIEQYEAAGDIQAYTIEVHALKSASRLIGATELADLAARLEACGHNKDIARIKSDTAVLLQLYRSYLPILAPHCVTDKPEIHKQAADASALRQALTALSAALEDFDLDAAQEAVQTLAGYQLSSAHEALYAQLCEQVDAMEYDEAAETATTWMESL